MDKARYSTMKRTLEALLNDFEILAGNRIGPSNVAMRDVIGTAHANASALTAELECALDGRMESFMVFPSPAEILDTDSETV